MSDGMKVAVVVGVGPGLGRALALRFARGGFAVALLARQEASLEPVQAEVEALGGRAGSYPCDTADQESVRKAFERIRHDLGAPEVLLYNAGAFKMGGILELSAEDLE